ncbi:hypothetical protein [Frondihabitans sp. PAMC 28766]|nr:hypothetical protein [Frondihabitans sp. PAMC 28766]
MFARLLPFALTFVAGRLRKRQAAEKSAAKTAKTRARTRTR